VNGIEAISITLDWHRSHHLYYMCDHFASAFIQSKWLSILGSDTQQMESNMQVFADWLHTIRDDGQPRFFRMHLDCYEPINQNKQFVNILKEVCLEIIIFEIFADYISIL